ncbi:MAG: hypothetical protein FWG41_00500 [Methanomassiliicoccaceae archaeon]|nr:hypothetical protein [Methanomassiliicoccaceae archaeon]
MIKVERYVWTILDIIGMVLLIVGVLGVIDILSIGTDTSIKVMAAGIVLIVVSSIFIQIEGMRLRREHDEFRRFDEIREKARLVPNDLDEGYLIDYTAEPGSAIDYKENEPPNETEFAEQNEDASDGDILIVYAS